MSANLEAKKLVVEEIKQKIKSAKSMTFVDYRGLTVDEDFKLRKACRESGAEYKVYKNRLMLRALKECGIEIQDSLMEGTLAVAFSYNDEVSGPKNIKACVDSSKKMSIKFGILDGKVIDDKVVTELATIPSKEVLIAMLLGMLQSPIRSFAVAMNAIAEKKGKEN